MADEKTIDELRSIFRTVFDDDDLVVEATTTADDIDEWDSLMHINLIATIEDEFGIEFDMADIAATRNVGDFADLIEKGRS